MSRKQRRCAAGTVVLAAFLGLAGCAGPSPLQDQQLRGVGTPGVSSYPGGDQATSLQAMLARCREVPEQAAAGPAGPATGSRDLSAACRQLRRTLHSQPGNTVQPGTTP